MKIVTLVENTSQDSALYAEHGLSLYIEACGKRILFDMGQTTLFEDNARALGVDLSAVDIAVLSHGHYDHGGGLARFLEINKTAPVYISKYAFCDYYNGTEKYIGLDKTLIESKRLVFTDGIVKIADGLTLCHCNGREKQKDLGSFGLNKKVDGVFLPDDFLHEQYLEIKENEKCVLISGCSHKGIHNIVHWFEPDVLVGGFHFSKLATDDTLAGFAMELGSCDTDFYTCHCTGKEQYDFMKKYMPRLGYLSVGSVVELN